MLSQSVGGLFTGTGMTVIYAPITGFLAYLADGWRLQDVAEPMAGHHGAYSVLLWRDA